MSNWVSYDKTRLIWTLDKLGPEYLMEVKRGPKDAPWEMKMRPTKKFLSKGSVLSSGKWDELLFFSLKEKPKAYIMMEDSHFYMAYENSLELVGKTLDFEIVGRYLPNKKTSSKKNISSDWKNSGIYFYKFGELITADIYGLALYLFGDINPSTVGQAYAWNNLNKYTPLSVPGGNYPFRLSDFTAAGNHYSPTGKVRGAIFFHNGVGFINGLEDLKKLFPDATTPQVRELYKKFDLEPSTHIRKIFGESKSPAPPEINSDPEKLYNYIRNFDLRKNPNGEGVLMYHPLKEDDIVVTSASDLARNIRMNGTGIGKKYINPLWELSLERDETQ